MIISQNAQRIPRSGIREMFEIARNYKDVVNLGIGETGFETPANIVEAGVKALRNGYTKYTSNAGILELRKVITNKLIEENNFRSIDKDNIIVTAGATEAIMLALLSIIVPGDEVIIPDPEWPNYIGQILLIGGRTVPVQTYEEDKFHLKAKSIEAAITPKTKVIILNSPSNPTGAVLTKEELESICQVVKKYNLIVISDEPYEKILYDGKKHVSIASLQNMFKHVITINSFSKTYDMTGWRVGYASGPKEVIDTMIKLQESLASSVNASAQMAAIEALQGSRNTIKENLLKYTERRDIMVSELNKIFGISCIIPEGSFFAFPNIKKLGYNSLDIAKLLLEKVQVVTTPGSAFGDGGEGYLRLSFAASTDKIKEGMKRIKLFIDKYIE